MPHAAARFRKYAILTHRWLGICFCVLFAMWFASGIVLMYWDYPGVAPADRMERAAPLNPAQICLSPQEAFTALGPSEPPDEVRIAMLAGRPAYRFRWGQDQSVVYADSGELQEFSPALARNTAADWAHQPAVAAHFEGALTEPDQWTVSGEFRALRPLYKYSWPDGVEVYVSRATGEVVQATTRGARLGAWFGAIPHWLYFTPLRRHGQLWSTVVIWASGIGTAMALFGLLVGVLMYSPAKRYRFPEGSSRVPYAGQKRWHTMLGLIFGLVTCTWVFSGMLSMDPFGFESSGQAFRLNQALRGGPLRLTAFAAKHPRQVLEQLDTGLRVKELELTTFAGEPAYLAVETPRRSRIIPLRGSPAQEFDPTQVTRLLAQASQPYGLAEVRLVKEYESYYLDRHHERPLPVLFVRLRDPGESMYYVDLKTARIVAGYVTRSRWNRWLYHGLHSLDLPWLYRHRPAWDLLVLALMLGGAALSVTALVIAWRRLRRKLRMHSAQARFNHLQNRPI